MLPFEISPMRALPLQKTDVGTARVRFEPKFDGWRTLAFRDETEVRLQSRNHKSLTRFFPDVVARLQSSLPPGTVIDGELVVWDAARQRTSFELLSSRITAGRQLSAVCAASPAYLVMFDILFLNGESLMQLPLHQRRRHLESQLESPRPGLELCPHTEDLTVAEHWMSAWSAAGVEGLVIKPANGPYLPGQAGWYKIRTSDTTEAVIAGVTGSLARPRTLLLGRLDSAGRLRYIGRTLPLHADVHRELAVLLRPTPRHPWPQPLPAAWQGQLGQPADLDYIAVHPLVAELVTDQAYEHGRFRHRPRLARPRPDLEPADVQRWTPSADDRAPNNRRRCGGR